MKAKVLILMPVLVAVLTWQGVQGAASQKTTFQGWQDDVASGVRDAPSAPSAGAWEQVYEHRGVSISRPGERSVVADAAGDLHAVYGGHLGLYYAHRSGGQWQHELIEAGPGIHASIALAGDGAPHICYLAGDDRPPVRYAWRDVAGWHTEFVHGDASSYRPCSIATGAEGAIAIAYSAGENVMFAYRDAAGWHAEPAAAGQAPSLSLALSDPGRADLAFGGDGTSSYGGLTYLYRDAAGWHSETVGDGSGNTPSLAVSSSGVLSLGYATSSAVIFATRSGSVWQSETVATGIDMTDTSLAVDPSGTPHVSFFDRTPSPDDPDGWAILGLSEKETRAPALLIGPSGTQYLSYLGPQHYWEGTIEKWRGVVAVRTGRDWRKEELAQGWAMSPVALALDGQGELRAAYASLGDYATIDIYYARRADGAWQSEKVADIPYEPPPYPDLAVSLALDATGRPAISYYDPALQGVRVLRWTGQASTPAPAPSPG